MSGPDGKTRGPRFSAGYQFPRTHAARITRGTPTRVARPAPGAVAQIVPLRGGLRRMWDVCGTWTVRDAGGPRTVQSTAIAYDELHAHSLFVELVRMIERETP